MGFFTTENQDTMKAVLKEFSEAARLAYPAQPGHPESHAFEAGYLQSLVVEMLPHLTKKMQKLFIEDMQRATRRQEKLAVERAMQKFSY